MLSHSSILEENRLYWTQRAAGYSAVNQQELADGRRRRWSEELCRQIDARFPQKRREDIRILEAGTGPGFFAILLAEAGYTVAAVDLTPEMLAEARKNAGDLAKKIDFREMNAEALAFADASFDVVISRNLTWNLPHPERAYAEWSRVLAAGGLLLNFDANWYMYLFDAAAREAYRQDRRNSAELGLGDVNVGEHFDVMEDIARRVPLSARRRPDWDVEILTGLGLRVDTDCRVWERVWDRQERTNCASTPLFLVRGEKGQRAAARGVGGRVLTARRRKEMAEPGKSFAIFCAGTTLTNHLRGVIMDILHRPARRRGGPAWKSRGAAA